MHCLLLGNGINRAALQKDWKQILHELARQFKAEDLLHHEKPLSMFIEELSARSEGLFRDSEHTIKTAFAGLLEQISPIEPHERICGLFKVILTTNYDFTVEEALAGPLHQPAFLAPESRYSLFRRHQAAGVDVWHIHGDVARPTSMVLGFDHYAGTLQKIRNYVTAGIDVKKVSYKVSSPVKNGILDFTRDRAVYSWVDYFLRDHIHIVGLGMDFTEIDLWWLLLHKRRRIHQTGKVFFYHLAAAAEPVETPVTSLLRSLNVEVVSVTAPTWTECYLRAAEAIEMRIASLPAHFPTPTRDNHIYDAPSPAKKDETKQGKFKFSRPRKPSPASRKPSAAPN
ncbi:SIR2 family protein [Pseudomonas syringae]|uniref:SIR2 family protein n=1 Tax=Pseudomonas syringae TaxID=317 RepID=UPI00200B88CE|nr:SIR2 family protein [Pseudomonas syringae]MCK9738067.1 SIR2 family protein [Pseudomonas syringae pv. syringae]